MSDKKVKYHINPKTGRPNQCTASIQDCKYAEDGQPPEHYDTKEEARAAYEQQNKNDTVKSLKKDNNDSSQENNELEQESHVKPATEEEKERARLTMNERKYSNLIRNIDNKLQNVTNPETRKELEQERKNLGYKLENTKNAREKLDRPAHRPDVPQAFSSRKIEKSPLEKKSETLDKLVRAEAKLTQDAEYYDSKIVETQETINQMKKENVVLEREKNNLSENSEKYKKISARINDNNAISEDAQKDLDSYQKEYVSIQDKKARISESKITANQNYHKEVIDKDADFTPYTAKQEDFFNATAKIINSDYDRLKDKRTHYAVGEAEAASKVKTYVKLKTSTLGKNDASTKAIIKEIDTEIAETQKDLDNNWDDKTNSFKDKHLADKLSGTMAGLEKYKEMFGYLEHS